MWAAIPCFQNHPTWIEDAQGRRAHPKLADQVAGCWLSYCGDGDRFLVSALAWWDFRWRPGSGLVLTRFLLQCW